MRVIDTKFYKEALRFIGYGCTMGWHERNAGNVSLRLIREEVESVAEEFCARNWVELNSPIDAMGREYIFTTVSGSYFIDMQYESETKFCICELSDDASRYRIVWGGEKPTSELYGHLLSLSELKKRDGGRAIYHAHPSNIVALSFLLPQTDEAVSRAIWSGITECAFVLPRGIGVVEFHVPGSVSLGVATAKKVREYDAVLWSHHGLFACGDTFSSAFGLAHAIEKSAEINLKVISSGQNPLGMITTEQQTETAEFFGYELNKFE